MGYVGIIVNLHWARIIDFAAGFAGFDPAGNDGRKLGLWPWQTDEGGRAVERPTEETRPQPRPKAEERPKPQVQPKAEEQPKPETAPKTDAKPVTEQKPTTGRSTTPRDPAKGLVREPVRDLGSQP